MDFKINTRYNFTVIAPAILGSNFNNVLVEAILPFTDAIKEKEDLVVTNTAVYQAANVLTVPDPTTLEYLRVSIDGKIDIISTSWITPNSVVEAKQVGTITIIIPDVTNDDLLKIQNLLKLASYTQATYQSTF